MLPHSDLSFMGFRILTMGFKSEVIWTSDFFPEKLSQFYKKNIFSQIEMVL